MQIVLHYLMTRQHNHKQQPEPHLPTNQPPKLQEPAASLANANVPAELGKLITRDENLLRKLGWRKLVTGRRQRGDFADMRKLQHPAKHLLQHTYPWSEVNQDTVPLAPMDAMQYGKALDRIVREILVSNPKYGPVKLSKTDLSDGFYRVNLRIEDIPKLALVFPEDNA